MSWRLTTALEAASERANRLTEALLGCTALAMALVIMVQVAARYLFNHSLFWSEELGRLLLVWLTFLGASVAYRRGAHPSVGPAFFRTGLGGRAALVPHTACLALFGLMAWHGWRLLDLVQHQQTTTLGLSKAVPFAALPVAAALMCLHAAAFLAAALHGDEP